MSLGRLPESESVPGATVHYGCDARWCASLSRMNACR